MLYYTLFSDIKSGKELYNLIKEFGIKATLAPAPRIKDLNCCGISILYYNSSDTEKIKNLADKNNISIFKFVETEENFNPERMKFL